jgi:hypothetical protein
MVRRQLLATGELAPEEQRGSGANLTPAHVYFGRGQTILLEREKIKRNTIENRRLNYRQIAA